MRRPTALFLLSFLLVLGFGWLPLHAADSPSGKMTADQLRLEMRELWEDHIGWTRHFIVSALADLPDKQATTERLLQNQKDIGNAIKPFYGDAAGTKLTGLLEEHILIAADIVTAAKAGDTTKLEADKQRWSANADQIATFLSGANPKHWPAADMKSMMNDHLATTTAVLEARLREDWKADVAAYERVHEQILEMSDMLAEGIAKQFPEKLRGK
jgi:hypothetical protein